MGLQKLLDICKCEIALTINEHRNVYQTASDAIKELEGRDFIDASEEVKAEMIARDTIIELQYYPNTPVGFNLIHHYDLDMAIDMALNNE